jgi:hypothetical protein
MQDIQAVLLLDELEAVTIAHAAGEITDEEAGILTATIQAKGLHHIRRTAGQGWSTSRMPESR